MAWGLLFFAAMTLAQSDPEGFVAARMCEVIGDAKLRLYCDQLRLSDSPATRATIASTVRPATLARLASYNWWETTATVDPITDAWECVARPKVQDRGSVFVAFKNGQLFAVSLLGDLDPRAEIAVRIDANQAYRASEGFKPPEAQRIVDEMLAGTVLRSQFAEWPRGGRVNWEWRLSGLRAAVDRCSSPSVR